MSYIPKDAVTQAFKSNKGVLTPNQIIELDNENKFTKYGQLELIETQTISSAVSTVTFSDMKSDTYDMHLLTITNYIPSVDNRHIGLRVQVDGSTISSSSYEYAMQRNTASTSSELKSTGDTKMWQIYNTGTDTGEAAHGYCYLYGAGDSTQFTFMTTQYTNINKDGNMNSNFSSGVYRVNDQVSGFELITSGDNMASGTFSLYGLRFA